MHLFQKLWSNASESNLHIQVVTERLPNTLLLLLLTPPASACSLLSPHHSPD